MIVSIFFEEGGARNENPLSFYRDLQNYMVWRFVMSMVSSLSGSYKDTRKEFRKVFPAPDHEPAEYADQNRIPLTQHSSG